MKSLNLNSMLIVMPVKMRELPTIKLEVIILFTLENVYLIGT